MEEQRIADRIHDAFQVEPLAGGFERFRLALEGASVTHRRSAPKQDLRKWAPLVAGFIAALIAASAIAYGIQSRAVPTKNPPRSGLSAQGIQNYWFYSSADVAVQLESPAGGARASVLITHDGGNTWFHAPLNADRIGLRWIDSLHLVATTDNVGPPFAFESSSDGGVTWRSTRLPNQWNLATYFLNASEGWALCNRFRTCIDGELKSLLYHTVDSGATWQQISTVIDSRTITPLDVYFVDRLHGFVSTRDDDNLGNLLATVDGGVTWRVINLPIPTESVGGSADCGTGTCVETPTMFGMRGVVTLISTASGAFTYTTTDGGATWGNPQPIPITLPGYLPTRVVAALDPNDWWTVDAVGHLYRTQDGGATWNQLAAAVPGGRILAWVTPASGGVLWGATVQGGASDHQYPVRSEDGGALWSIVKLPIH